MEVVSLDSSPWYGLQTVACEILKFSVFLVGNTCILYHYKGVSITCFFSKKYLTIQHIPYWNLRYKIINHIFWLNSGLFGGMFIKQASQPINMQGYFNNNKGADTKKTKLCLRGWTLQRLCTESRINSKNN